MYVCNRISIHALRVEGDRRSLSFGRSTQNFYPRPPGGGRLIAVLVLIVTKGISIHALRVEGDLPQSPRSSTRSISIHALRVEGDHPFAIEAFNIVISIHALRVEGDR